MGSYMRIFIQINRCLRRLGAVIVGLAACSPRRIPPTSVTDLMENRVMLDGVLMKCNQNPSKARTDSDCNETRESPLIGSPAKESRRKRRKRTEEFEQSREKRRLAQKASGKNRKRRPRWMRTTCRWCGRTDPAAPPAPE